MLVNRLTGSKDRIHDIVKSVISSAKGRIFGTKVFLNVLSTKSSIIPPQPAGTKRKSVKFMLFSMNLCPKPPSRWLKAGKPALNASKPALNLAYQTGYPGSR